MNELEEQRRLTNERARMIMSKRGESPQGFFPSDVGGHARHPSQLPRFPRNLDCDKIDVRYSQVSCHICSRLTRSRRFAFNSLWSRLRESAEMGWPTCLSRIHHINVPAEGSVPCTALRLPEARPTTALDEAQRRPPSLREYPTPSLDASEYQHCRRCYLLVCSWRGRGTSVCEVENLSLTGYVQYSAVIALVNVYLDAHESQRVEAGHPHILHCAVKLIQACLLFENPMFPERTLPNALR